MFQYVETSIKGVINSTSAAGVSQTRPVTPNAAVSPPPSAAMVDSSSCGAVVSPPRSAAVVDNPPPVVAGQSSSLDASQMVSAVH